MSEPTKITVVDNGPLMVRMIIFGGDEDRSYGKMALH
jgi:hypothetical protein